MVKTSFIFPTNVVKDSSDLTFKIIFHNTSKKTAFVYTTLVHSSPGDEDGNIYVDVEKFDGHNYKYYPLVFYHKMSETKTDTICRDIDKRGLESLSSDTLSFNLLMIGKYFESGKYRFKVKVRKRCKIILPKGDGDTWHADINYVSSNWLYFQASRSIFSNWVEKE